MEFIRNFSTLGRNDAAIAGGKGASLGEMTQAGIPVPPGYVVLSDAFEHFLEETDLNVEIDAILHRVDHKEMHTLENASEEIRALILNAEMPQDIREIVVSEFAKLGAEFVAVRSSATSEDSASAAWAGQLDSFLNTKEDTLLENVKRCWASLFTPRAIFYRFEKGLDTTKISVAVVVQKMIQSEISGIAFSVHPVTEDYNQLIIEAGYGLGEAIVSGQITPDSYVVEKEPLKTIDINISEQRRKIVRAIAEANEWVEVSAAEGDRQKLTNDEILELAKLIIKIEQHYGFPCDIEWAREGGNFYIVQSRPITTLAPKTQKSHWKDDALADFKPDNYEFHGLWKSNVLTDYFWSNIFVPEIAAELDLGIDEIGSFKINEGNFFESKTIQEKLHQRIIKAIEAKDLGFFVKIKDFIDQSFKDSLPKLTLLSKEKPSGDIIKEITGILRPLTMVECIGYLLSYSFEEELRGIASGEGIALENILDYIKKVNTPLFKHRAELGALKQKITSALGDIWPKESAEILKQIENNTSIKEAFASHLAVWGWIDILGFLGMPLSPLRLVQMLRESEDKKQPENRAEKFSHSDRTSFVFDAAYYVAYVRQIGAEYFSIMSFHTRPILEKAAEVLGLSWNELVRLTPDEIAESLDNSQLAKDISTRRASGKWAMFQDRKLELHMIEDLEDVRELENLMLRHPESKEDVLTGDVANKGIGRGKVRIVLEASQSSHFQTGDILVTMMTTPDFVPLMQKASAIITEIGGFLSHAAIVSRELNKPCIIGIKNITNVLKDGDDVEVDADNGVVRILKSEKKIQLSKIFSREKSLFHFTMWNDSDRMGYRDFLGYEVQNNLFIILPPGQKGSVWYSSEELGKIDALVKAKIKSEGEGFIDSVMWRLDMTGKVIFPFLLDEKHISSVEDFKLYYTNLVSWWSALNTVFTVPDMTEVPEEIRSKILKYRIQSEKYTEKINKVMVEYFKTKYPAHTSISQFVTPQEVMQMDENTLDKEELDSIYGRISGCFMLNGEVQPLGDLDKRLSEAGIKLEEASSENTEEIRGSVAYKGKARGIVKKILGFKDMFDFRAGDILVTEMTNPDYLPIVKIAAAVVTDEGGATCHAAIACRELKIPCIVGTKNATQILKDGDDVEVDADNGVVRILNSSAQIVFKKSYQRDTTLFVQELWAKGLSERAEAKFGWKNPHLPFIVHFVNDGAVEIWEHQEAIAWFLDKLLEANQNPAFLKELLEEYRKLLPHIKALHEKKDLAPEDLKQYADLLYEAVFAVTIFFYTGIDERSSQAAKDISVLARKEEDLFAANDAFVRKIFSKRGKISEELAGVVLAEEANAIPSSELLEKRLEAYLLIDGKEMQLGNLDEFASQHPEYLFITEALSTDTKELKGQSAYNGIVTGTVRIVRKQSDMVRVKAGDILVSPMTTPDFMPAMEKAAAFVTDEGGVTCHAAIVAREMKKPCVIGTKFATQLIKDGDEVEVDADKGIVRILNHR